MSTNHHHQTSTPDADICGELRTKSGLDERVTLSLRATCLWGTKRRIPFTKMQIWMNIVSDVVTTPPATATAELTPKRLTPEMMTATPPAAVAHDLTTIEGCLDHAADEFQKGLQDDLDLEAVKELAASLGYVLTPAPVAVEEVTITEPLVPQRIDLTMNATVGLPVWNGIGQPGSVMPIPPVPAAVEDPSEDPEYQAHVERLAADCGCNDGPCDACLAGAPCDAGPITTTDVSASIAQAAADHTAEQVDREMTERPTPITDLLERTTMNPADWILLARDLERQLAEAREGILRNGRFVTITADQFEALHRISAACQCPAKDAEIASLKGQLAEARDQRDAHPTAVITRGESGMLSITECPETFLCSRAALEMMVRDHNALIRERNESRTERDTAMRRANKLAAEALELTEQRDALAEALEGHQCHFPDESVTCPQCVALAVVKETTNTHDQPPQ